VFPKPLQRPHSLMAARIVRSRYGLLILSINFSLIESLPKCPSDKCISLARISASACVTHSFRALARTDLFPLTCQSFPPSIWYSDARCHALFRSQRASAWSLSCIASTTCRNNGSAANRVSVLSAGVSVKTSWTKPVRSSQSGLTDHVLPSVSVRSLPGAHCQLSPSPTGLFLPLMCLTSTI
jgi:hypothetical protein